ncbi:dTDP-glucose 4,6-dehydratase [Desulfatibacillum aliphaticivorans]|uniref:dTDP-glucose 4,6-dehydratase n=1 Tax=Desulfatibacillum aliphaticivorans TaxID=218208 RepID=B8FH94_DESAL|nr:dTDP-glucose 4,6-dehydratase [Desulfatibacillum aliphaticivorans]ACL02182.1 dTDP-glucose 4,6-dehydratase [Desulfatibacillum aliphaticivorans]
MNRRKILLTGGAGFIGSNFILQALREDPHCGICNLDALTYAGSPRNFQGLPRDQASRHKLVHGNICDAALLERLFLEEDFDAVVHFAAESHVDRSIKDALCFASTNVMGTCTLLEAARQNWESRGRPRDFLFIHVSTDEVFGSLGPEGSFSQASPYDPSSPYSASKAASDHFVRAYHRTYGLPCVVSNCSNNYGPYQFPEKLIPLMLMQILDQKPLPVYGDGQNVRDWLFVEDHCRALMHILEKGAAGETYIIGGGEEKTNLEVVHLLCELADRKLNRPASEDSKRLISMVKDRPGHDRRYAMDFSETTARLGWKPAHTFRQGLEATVDWYLSNRTWVEQVRSGEYRNWVESHYK